MFFFVNRFLKIKGKFTVKIQKLLINRRGLFCRKLSVERSKSKVINSFVANLQNPTPKDIPPGNSPNRLSKPRINRAKLPPKHLSYLSQSIYQITFTRARLPTMLQVEVSPMPWLADFLIYLFENKFYESSHDILPFAHD